MNKTLYAKDVNGTIRVWNITAHDSGLTITHGVLGGSKQTKEEQIMTGDAHKSKEEKIYSRYLSRINSKTDAGYMENLDEAKKAKRVNGMGLLRPMLAAPIKNVRGIKYENAFYQHKYDGNRCLVTKRNDKVIAYSRNGKPISSIGHIIQGIELGEGQTIDGELYCHGVVLQTICSWIKREQDATLNLSLRVYDIVEDSPYIDRLSSLRSLQLGDNASLVPTYRVESEQALDDFLEGSLREGYEGGILRWGEVGYQDGKRSKNLAKIKVFEDDEYRVVDIEESKDGWAILVCIMNASDKTFRVSAPGSMDHKYDVAREPHLYIGKKVQVKYANLTKDGIPFHPVATMFRDKHEE